jgi:ComF family protein
LDDRPICSICLDALIGLDGAIVDREPSEHVDGWARRFRYEGRAAQAVRRLKFSRVTSLASTMADLMREFVDALRLRDVEAFVPVPIHWSRRFFRGFNQSELLCMSLPQERVKPELLVRRRATHPQVGLTPEQRRLNLQGAFCASPDVKGLSIVLIDDVLTSGHTVRECSRVLKSAGALEVYAVTFAGSGA